MLDYRIASPHGPLPDIARARGAGRRGLRFGRRGGGRAPSLTPANDPLRLLDWNAYDLASTPVTTWTDRVAGITADEPTAPPAWSATAIGGAYPGVTFNGTTHNMHAANAGTVLSGKTTLTVIVVMVDTSTTSTIALEYTGNSPIVDGGIGINPNYANVDGRLAAITRGTTGYTLRYGTESLSSARVCTFVHNFAAAGVNALPSIRVNGTALSLTDVSSLSASGSAANSTLYFGARAGTSLFWPGTMGRVFIRNSNDTGTNLLTLERAIGAEFGIVF